MALQSQFLSSVTTNVGHSFFLLLCPTRPSPSLTIRSQKDSSEPSNSEDPPPLSSSAPKKGFGSSNSNASASAAVSTSSKRKEKKGRRERASIIRRTPLEKPAFVSQVEKGKATEPSKNESAFLLAWLGFGAVILVEGIALAASGIYANHFSLIRGHGVGWLLLICLLCLLCHESRIHTQPKFCRFP